MVFRRGMGRVAALAAGLGATAVIGLSAGGPAFAASHKTAAKGAKPLELNQATPAKATGDATTPQSLGQFGDWQAFQVGGGKTRSCFAISNPKDRQPSGLNRDPATLFITQRPAEGVRNEISIIAGFGLKDGQDATLKIGSASYALYTKDANAWVKNAAEQGTILTTMKKSRDLSFVGTSKRGRTTTDSYSLSGFGAAVDAISKACS